MAAPTIVTHALSTSCSAVTPNKGAQGMNSSERAQHIKALPMLSRHLGFHPVLSSLLLAGALLLCRLLQLLLLFLGERLALLVNLLLSRFLSCCLLLPPLVLNIVLPSCHALLSQYVAPCTSILINSSEGNLMLTCHIWGSLRSDAMWRHMGLPCIDT